MIVGGRLREYYAKWDYAIDAFVGPWLEGMFPEGCFVPLPPDFRGPRFSDGATVRELAVFQMKPEGIVDCPTP